MFGEDAEAVTVCVCHRTAKKHVIFVDFAQTFDVSDHCSRRGPTLATVPSVCRVLAMSGRPFISQN